MSKESTHRQYTSEMVERKYIPRQWQKCELTKWPATKWCHKLGEVRTDLHNLLLWYSDGMRLSVNLRFAILGNPKHKYIEQRNKRVTPYHELSHDVTFSKQNNHYTKNMMYTHRPNYCPRYNYGCRKQVATCFLSQLEGRVLWFHLVDLAYSRVMIINFSWVDRGTDRRDKWASAFENASQRLSQQIVSETSFKFLDPKNKLDPNRA